MGLASAAKKGMQTVVEVTLPLEKMTIVEKLRAMEAL